LSAFFGAVLFSGCSRITAGRAAVDEKFFFTGKAAGWAADRRKKTPAMGAGFSVVLYFVSAVVAEKPGLLFQCYADFDSVLDASPELEALLLCIGHESHFAASHGFGLSVVLSPDLSADLSAAFPELPALSVT
jgi:hypothetical protein